MKSLTDLNDLTFKSRVTNFVTQFVTYGVAIPSHYKEVKYISRGDIKERADSQTESVTVKCTAHKRIMDEPVILKLELIWDKECECFCEHYRRL